MKKIVSLVTAIILLLSVAVNGVVFAQAAPELVVSNVTGYIGDQVEIKVQLKNSLGFGGMAYDVKYDNTKLKLISYETDLGTMKRHIVQALDMGENVIIGYTQTDNNNIIINGHEITIIGYKTDNKGKMTFICNDTDDNISKPIEYTEDYLLPKIHHAALPQEIVEKDLNIVPNWIEGIQMYKEMKREAEQQRFAQQPQVA